MELITTGATIIVAAMGLKLVHYGVTTLSTIIRRGEDSYEQDFNK